MMSGRKSAGSKCNRFSLTNLIARTGAIRASGAPYVTLESSAQAAEMEKARSESVRALPSAFRERQAKNRAASDQANPQAIASL